MSKCFVSFSSRDGEFAGKLLASFRLQEVDVWDYSNAAHDTPLGESVKEDLRRRIDASDHFIAVITPSSTHFETGRFCIFEMQYANSRGKRIIPITLAQYLPLDPQSQLTFLQDAKYLSFDLASNEAYERSFARLCGEIGAPYVPPFLGDPRVIFAPRFDKEIRGLAFQNEHRVQLRLTIDEFTRQYAAGQWAEAQDSILFFIGCCKRWLTGVALYYPIVLLALCQVHRDQLDQAVVTLKPLADHPLADENLWAALGQIDFIRGQYGAALANFKIARDKCPKGKDWEARFNILAASVALGQAEEASAAFSGYDVGLRPLDDQVKIANLQALLFARRGDWGAVVAVLRDLVDRKIGDAASAIYLSQAYERRGESRAAVAVLASEADRLCDLNLYHRLAALEVRLGDPIRALEIYESRLLADPARPWQMATDYALILRSIGRHREATEFLRRSLSLPRPEVNAEIYFRGLAHYLLGRNSEARTYFTDSHYAERFYDQLV